MKYPSLVPPWACNVNISVCLTNGVTERGEPQEYVAYTGLCNYSEKSKQVIDAERRLVQLEATAIIPGDIAPGKDLSGYVTVGIHETTIKRMIYRSSRGRNPDGTVNFTQLELM